MIGEKSSLTGAMQVHIGKWLSSAVLHPLGIFLTYKATTDSPLMDLEVWNKVFGRFNVAKYLKKFRKKGD
jgi:lipopolysaccharide export system permease protein